MISSYSPPLLLPGIFVLSYFYGSFPFGSLDLLTSGGSSVLGDWNHWIIDIANGSANEMSRAQGRVEIGTEVSG